MIEARFERLKARFNHHTNILSKHDAKLKEHDTRMDKQDKILENPNEILETLKIAQCEHMGWIRATHGIVAANCFKWQQIALRGKNCLI